MNFTSNFIVFFSYTALRESHRQKGAVTYFVPLGFVLSNIYCHRRTTFLNGHKNQYFLFLTTVDSTIYSSGFHAP